MVEHPAPHRHPPGPPLLSAKECKERMKHMLIGCKGARVFLACLRERINALDASNNGIGQL